MVRAQERSQRGAQGFTLIEVLVATGLVTLVLGLAMKGFMESKRIADITKAKVIAADEASQGVQRVAKVLQRCHVIYFDARPLVKVDDVNPENVGGQTSLATIRLGAVPALLTSAGTNVNVYLGTTTDDKYRSPIRMAGLAAINRALFRVNPMDDDDAGEDTEAKAASPARVLKTGARKAGGGDLDRAFDRFFTSPLLYCAEAVFNTNPPDAGGLQVDPNLPMTWTFYLVYLAPMPIDPADDGNALFPVQEAGNASLNAKRDLGPEGWLRATIPYELRMLTIPDVVAIKTAGASGSLPANNAAPSAGPPIVFGRRFGRRLDTVGVLPFPYDVDKDFVNYDPVALPMGANAKTEAYKLLVDNNKHFGDPSFARVLSGSAGNAGYMHGNWNNIGNDPPTQEALSNRAAWTGTTFGAAAPITDTVLAQHVDPDAVNGTFVRLANNANLIADGEAASRAWVNAYGGPQKYCPRWWNLGNPLTVQPPTRALVSVSTRFRYSRQHPYAFANESVEVDLEPLMRYQDRNMRYRRQR